MKRRRFCWLGLMIPLGVLLVPPLLWLLIVLVAPTNWARTHIVAALERASGRSVQLDDLDVCLGGGVALTNLKIGAPGAIGEPWLVVPKAQIDVSPLQLLCGKFEPKNLEVDGATLRVLRRADGSLELADLVKADPVGPGSSGSEAHTCGLSKLRARLRQARILLLDRPSGTRLEFEGVDGEGVWEGGGAFVATLTGRVNGGPFAFTAHFDRTTGPPNFEGQFRASDVALEQGMSALRYLVPVLAGAPGQLQGKLDMDVYLRGQGQTRESLEKTLVGHGSVSLDPIQLAGTPLMAEIARVVEIPAEETIGSIRSAFVIQDGRITTDRLALTAARVPILVSGWTDFGGRMNYQVKVDGLVDKVPEKARQFLSGLDLDLGKLTQLTLSGSVDAVEIKLNRPSADRRSPVAPILSNDDRERLRVLGRRLREKVLR
jgi:AsmA protein